jgi:hypothetical protein
MLCAFAAAIPAWIDPRGASFDPVPVPPGATKIPNPSATTHGSLGGAVFEWQSLAHKKWLPSHTRAQDPVGHAALPPPLAGGEQLFVHDPQCVGSSGLRHWFPEQRSDVGAVHETVHPPPSASQTAEPLPAVGPWQTVLHPPHVLTPCGSSHVLPHNNVVGDEHVISHPASPAHTASPEPPAGPGHTLLHEPQWATVSFETHVPEQSR